MSGPFTTITVTQYYAMQDRIRALEKVAEAATQLVERARLACGYPAGPNDPPALYDVRDLEKALVRALAAFDS